MADKETVKCSFCGKEFICSECVARSVHVLINEPKPAEGEDLLNNAHQKFADWDAVESL